MTWQAIGGRGRGIPRGGRYLADHTRCASILRQMPVVLGVRGELGAPHTLHTHPSVVVRPAAMAAAAAAAIMAIMPPV